MSPKSNATKRPAPRPSRATKTPHSRAFFTWLAVGIVVTLVAVLVVIKVATSSTTTSSATGFTPTSATVAAELTHVPASVFNTVGVTSPVAAVTAPQTLKNQPELFATITSGRKVPEVLYVGGEFCPYCAAQRWSTIIALSRFGTWSGLGNMASYAGDSYPRTPTFTFVRAKYYSPYLVFKGVEEYADAVNPTTGRYVPLQKLTPSESALFKKYDSSKYVTGLPSSDDGAFPFLDFANKFLTVGASYEPSVLAGETRDEVAAGLSNPESPLTQVIIASANYQTSVLCTLTHQQPSSVCTSAGVKDAKVVPLAKS